jgi:hypothetical protein
MRAGLLLIVINILVNLTVFAQNQSFFTFDFKGKVYVKEKGVEKQIERKTSFSQKSILIVKENSSAILFRESDGVPVNVKHAGNYSFAKLMELADASKPNVTSYFLDFCKTEIIKSHDKEINKGTGVVSRGGGDYPMLLPPDSSLVMDLLVSFSWQPYKASKQTYFIITDSTNNKILKLSTTDTTITIFPYSCGLEEGKTYFWIVSDKQNPNDDDRRYSFELSSSKNNENILKNMSSYKRSLFFEDEENILLLAKFYENNKLYQEAFSTYQNAVTKYPASENLRINYNLFKAKIGL